MGDFASLGALRERVESDLSQEAAANAQRAVNNLSIEAKVEKVTDYLSEGQIVKVKVLETDEKGRIKLSMKALLDRDAPSHAPSEGAGE